MASSDGESPQRIIIDEPISEDLSEEIEAFVRLNRFGQFKEGDEFFEGALKNHLDIFPVVAEYADFLLEQGRYHRLAQFLQERLSNELHIKGFAEDEIRLLELMKVFAELRTTGGLKKALGQARHHWSMARRTITENPSEAQIQFVEVYLRIIVFSARMSNWLQPKDYDMPWTYSSVYAKLSWDGFEQWCRRLSKGEYLWEAQKVLRILLDILSKEDATRLFQGLMGDMSEKEETEPVLLARVATLTAYFRYAVQLGVDVPDEEIVAVRVQLKEAISALRTWEDQEGRPSLEARLVDATYLERLGHSGPGIFDPYDLQTVLDTARRLSDFELEAEYLWTTASRDDVRLLEKPTSDIIEDMTRLRKLHLEDMLDTVGYVDHIDHFVGAQIEKLKVRPSSLRELDISMGDSPARQRAFDIPVLRFNEAQNRIKMKRVLESNSEALAAEAEANKIKRDLPESSRLMAAPLIYPSGGLRLEKLAPRPMTKRLGTRDEKFDKEPNTVTGSVVEFAFGDEDQSYFATSYPHRAEYAKGDIRTVALLNMTFVNEKLEKIKPQYIMNIAIRSPELWFMYCYRRRFAYDSKWFPKKPSESDKSVGAQLAILKEEEIDQISYCAFGESPTTYFLRSTDNDKGWHPRLSRDVPWELYNAYQEEFRRGCPRGVTFGKNGAWILYGRGKGSFKWSKHGLPNKLEAALAKGYDEGLTINKVVLNRKNSEEYVLVYDEGPVYYSLHEGFVDSFKEVIEEWSAGMRNCGKSPNHKATFFLENQSNEDADYDGGDVVEYNEPRGGNIVRHRRTSTYSQTKSPVSAQSAPPGYYEIS